MNRNAIDVAEIQRRFEYDSETGIITNKIKLGNSALQGAKAGSDTGTRLIIRVKGKTYAYSRIAWAIHHGEDPGELVIDHINGDPRDNRIANLRACTQRQNMHNRQAMGIYKRERGNTWYSLIRNNEGRQINLGDFACPLLARIAYEQAATEMRGEFAAV